MIHRLPFKDRQPSHNITEAVKKRTDMTKSAFEVVGKETTSFASKLWRKMTTKKEKPDEE
jgi:hypothetical protein